MKVINERVHECLLWWFGHVEKMENDRNAKRVYVGECAGRDSVGRPWKKWIDTVKDYLRERNLEVRQARRMTRVCEEECMGCSQVDEPLTLMRCHSYMKPLG